MWYARAYLAPLSLEALVLILPLFCFLLPFACDQCRGTVFHFVFNKVCSCIIGESVRLIRMSKLSALLSLHLPSLPALNVCGRDPVTLFLFVHDRLLPSSTYIHVFNAMLDGCPVGDFICIKTSTGCS